MINEELQLASIKLFHAVKEVEEGKKIDFSKLVKYGIILINKSGIVKEVNERLAKIIINNLGINSLNWSSSFHKSWDKVATAPIELLIAEQIFNYFSVYGMESIGLESFNYIPAEKILVNFDQELPLSSFIVVRVLNEEELNLEIKNFVYSVKSPHKDDIEYIRCLLLNTKDIDINLIKSFEIKTIYCNIHGLVPSEGQDFLRLAIYRASNGKITTIVKDNNTIRLLKLFSTNTLAEEMFKKADIKKLSETFYRFKPLYLAFKTNKNLANIINKIRRYATTNHIPLSGFVVSNLMNLLSLGKKEESIKVIDKADIRELIKLINFSKYEINAKEHIYNIRNGKIFVKVEDEENNSNIIRLNNLEWLYNICIKKLKILLNNVYSGMTFYIPQEIEYAMPVSEKQMMEMFPYGSKIKLPNDANAICIGGHWFNQDSRVDLDFHLNSITNSFGWNSNYRSEKRDILFSGDMTDAPLPLGAVEAYRISSSVTEPYILTVNDYNTEGKIPFELLFTKDLCEESRFQYKTDNEKVSAVINPVNAIIPIINLKMHKKEEVIGIYNNRTFTLYGGDIGGGHRCPNKKLIKNILNAIISKCEVMMTAKEFIELGGGKVVDKILEDMNSYIDFSICNLTSTTFIDLLNLNKDNFVVKNKNIEN